MMHKTFCHQAGMAMTDHFLHSLALAKAEEALREQQQKSRPKTREQLPRGHVEDARTCKTYSSE